MARLFYFNLNREWYETEVKKPFTAFVEELITRMRAEDSTLAISTMVETENLHKIRQAIVKNLAEFDSLLKEKGFKQKYGSLQGEQNKVLPAEFKEHVSKQPLLANKQFYYMAELEAATIFKKNLPELMLQYYRAGKALHAFLKRAMTG